MYIYICVCMYLSTHISGTWLCKHKSFCCSAGHAPLCVYIYIYIYIVYIVYIYIYIYIHICVYNICAYVYIYTCVYVYIHTHFRDLTVHTQELLLLSRSCPVMYIYICIYWLMSLLFLQKWSSSFAGSSVGRIHTYIRIHLYTQYMYVWVCVCICTHTFPGLGSAFTRAAAVQQVVPHYAWMCMCVYVCVCVCVCVCVYLNSHLPEPHLQQPLRPGHCDVFAHSTHLITNTGWRKRLRLQVSFCQIATDDRAFLRKMNHEDKASCASSPPCSMIPCIDI